MLGSRLTLIFVDYWNLYWKLLQIVLPERSYKIIFVWQKISMILETKKWILVTTMLLGLLKICIRIFSFLLQSVTFLTRKNNLLLDVYFFQKKQSSFSSVKDNILKTIGFESMKRSRTPLVFVPPLSSVSRVGAIYTCHIWRSIVLNYCECTSLVQRFTHTRIY